MIAVRPLARCVAWVLIGLLCGECAATEENGQAPIDLDAWHATRGGNDQDEPEQRHFVLGLYPGMSGVLGTPSVASYQGNLYLSLSDSRSFSLFFGYGEERGSSADAEIFTLGWGGVRRLPVATRQRGFYGKFVRYRRWHQRDHGLHHGVSFGTESGVGLLALVFEVGAARSTRNHWMAIVQVGFKIAVPVWIPLSHVDE